MFEFKAIPDDLSALDPEALYFLVDQYGATYIGRIEGTRFEWVPGNSTDGESWWRPVKFGFAMTRLECGRFEVFPRIPTPSGIASYPMNLN